MRQIFSGEDLGMDISGLWSDLDRAARLSEKLARMRLVSMISLVVSRVVEAGYRNVMGTHPLPIIHYGLDFSSFLRLWRRWLFFGRGGIPASFVRPFAIRCVSFYVALGLATAALLLGPLWAVVPPVLLWILEGVHHLQLHRLYGGMRVPLRYAWMAWVPWLILVPVGVSMLFRPELDWRGHVYRVDWEARLDARRTGEG